VSQLVSENQHLFAPAVRPARRNSSTFGTSAGGLDFLFDAAVACVAFYYLVASTIDLFDNQPRKWAAGLVLLVCGLVSIVGLVAALRRTQPIFVIIFFFNYIFLSIGPLRQLAIIEDPIYGDDDLVLFAVSLCLAFCVLGLPFLFQKADQTGRSKGFMWQTVNDGHFQPQVLFVTSLAFSLALLAFYWPALLTTREAMDTYLGGIFSKPFLILFHSFLNPFAFLSAFIGWAVAWRRRSLGWVAAFTVCLIPAMLINNPLSFARFRVSAVIVFACLVQFGVKRVRFLLLLLATGTLMSSFLNTFRFNVSYGQDPDIVRGGTFAGIDFHILNLLCYSIKYARDYGYSYGSNIVSAMLFFVPRAVWESKSDYISSYLAPMISKYRYYGTDDLSSPLIAEGYFAYGVIGALLLSAVALYCLRLVEKRGLAAPWGSPWHLILCLLPMLTMILMRGPFIVGYWEIISHIAALFAAIILLRFSSGLRNGAAAMPGSRY
jgi:hypothetical protein